MADEQTLNSVIGDEETLDQVAEGLVVNNQVRMPSSETSVAAYTALLAGGGQDAVPVYNAAKMDAAEGQYSQLDGLLENHKRLMSGVVEQEVRAAMADENITPRAKADILLAQKAMEDMRVNEAVALREQSASLDSEGDTAYDEVVRDAATVPRTSDLGEAQAKKDVVMAQARLYEGDASLGEVMFDTAVLFGTPLTEQIESQSVVEFMTGEHPGFLSMLGSNQKELATYFSTLTDQQLVYETDRLIKYFEHPDNTVLWMKNDLNALQYLRDEIITGSISDTEVFVNNLVSVLDMGTLVGGRIVKGIVSLVKGGVKPGAPLKALGGSNAGKKREAIADIVDNEEGEVAEAYAGTDRGTVIADEHLPELADESGIIDNTKVYDPTKVDSFTDREKAAKALELEGDFAHFDPKLNFGASEVNITGVNGQFKIGAVYGRTNGGWATPEDAFSNTKFQLAKHGVAEQDMTLLRNTEEGFVPVDPKEYAGVPGEYKIKVDTEIEMSAMDARDASVLTVDYGWVPGMNWLGQQAAKINPTLPRYLLSPGDLFKDSFINPAFTSVDQAAQLEKNLLEIGAEWGRAFSDLPKAEQNGLWEYLQLANKDGLSDSPDMLRARGLNDRQIEAAQKFRKFWDEQYRLDNLDKKRTLQGRGYQVFEHGKGESYMKFFARPVQGPNGVPNSASVYDPLSDTAEKWSFDELTQLYENGGTVARLPNPVKIGDDWHEYILVDNTKYSYLRGFNAYDEVVDYRPGYYHVKYDAPYYVRASEVTADGVKFERAVGVAGSQEEAEAMLKQFADEKGVTPEKYGRVSLSKESDAFDDEMSLAVSGGRSSQRHRGERLEQGLDPNNNADRYVMGPVDAMINAARSISRRTSTRMYLEGMKGRWMKRFGKYVTDEKYGEPVWPTEFNKIGRPGEIPDAEYAAALQTWEYIRYLENGYVASMDVLPKMALNAVAAIAGKAGAKGVEETAKKWSTNAKIVSPVKGLAFQAYLALNPLRQYMVQAHQSIQLLAIAPKYVANPMGLMRDTNALILGNMLKQAGRTKDYKKLADTLQMDVREMDEMIEGFQNSGLTASIDHQNLVESSLNQMMDNAVLKGKGARTLGQVVTAPRKFGFDAGENFNLITAWATMRHLGKVQDAGLDKVAQSRKWAAEARNYTYQMNRAGDMPYNQNSLGAIMQFMQVPHKAMTTMLFNKQLTAKQKASLAATNLVLYGVPTAALQSLVTSIPGMDDSPEMQDVAVHGLEQWVVNKGLEAVTGEESNLSLRSLMPVEFGGWAELYRAVASGGLSELWENTPSGALLGGRVPDAFVQMTRGLIPWKKTEGQPDATFFSRMEALLSISSGFSNAFQAAAMAEYGKQYSRNGTLLDTDVTTPDVLGKILGLSSKEAEARMELSTRLYERQADIKADVAEWHRMYKQALNYNGDIEDTRARLDQLAVAWNVWSDPEVSAVAREELDRLIGRDMADPDQRLMKNMMRAWGIQDLPTFKRLMREANFPKETYESIIRLLETAENPDG